MADVFVVAGDRTAGDIYLCRLLDTARHGHSPTILPVVQVLRMLRFPAQHAQAPGWQDRAVAVSPLRDHDVARLSVIREATRTDLTALTWFRDYAASMRFCAFEAMRDTTDPGERRRIGLQLTGPPRRVRSAYILSKLETLEAINGCETPGEI